MAAVLVVAGIALAVWAQAQPLIDSSKASSIALDFQAQGDSGWRVDSTTLDNSGKPPPHGNQPPFSALPKCWGASLPVGDGYCLPYPYWRVHLVGPPPLGDCLLAFVDARTARMTIIESAPC